MVPPSSRRAPGRRKRAKTRAIPTVPVVAGVATLIAASAGAVALTSHGSGAKSPGLTLGRSMPQTMALGADRLSEARKAAAARSDRSKRDNAASERARLAELAKDREAWEARHNLELADAEKRAGASKGTSVLTRNVQWFMPVSNYRLSAGYGQSSSLWSSTHTGQDFAVPIGTPVKAIGNARVVQTGWDGPYGKQVRLVHEDGTETWYCHLSRWSVGDGERVRAGEVVGYSGSTGNSTGPHLHLEVRPGGGDPIDPMPWLRERGLL